MNYLAHLYLSGSDKEIMTGNFIGDHIKGKNYTGLSGLMIKGIGLHRAIDSFTDVHPVVMHSKLRLRPVFHKYAPVIADVFYDHFLAKNWNEYSAESLQSFTDNAYAAIMQHHFVLPLRAQRMLSYMIPQNWLLNYAGIEGINKALSGMAKRTVFDSGMENAASYLLKDYDLYHAEFNIFFPQLESYCKQFLNRLL